MGVVFPYAFEGAHLYQVVDAISQSVSTTSEHRFYAGRRSDLHDLAAALVTRVIQEVGTHLARCGSASSSRSTLTVQHCVASYRCPKKRVTTGCSHEWWPEQASYVEKVAPDNNNQSVLRVRRRGIRRNIIHTRRRTRPRRRGRRAHLRLWEAYPRVFVVRIISRNRENARLFRLAPGLVWREVCLLRTPDNTEDRALGD